MPLHNAMLAVGDTARLGAHVVQNLGRGPRGVYKLQTDGGRTVYRSPEQLLELHHNHQFRVISKAADAHGSLNNEGAIFDLAALPASVQVDTIRRERYMHGIRSYLEEEGSRPLSHNAIRPVLKKVFEKLATEAIAAGEEPPEKAISTTAALRWFKRYRECDWNLIALVEDRRGNTHPRLDPVVRTVMDRVIQERYLTLERINIQKAHRILVGDMMVLNRDRALSKKPALPTPSYEALRSAIGRLDQFDVLSKRFGYTYAVKALRAYGATPPAERHLQRVQMDHTLLDLEVECSDKIRFRPWLTLAIDVHTRAVLGYLLSANPPSATSVMECLRVACLPKNVEVLGGEHTWPYPMYGMPQELQVDNGKEFHSNDLKVACAQLGITLTYCPPRQPYYKAQVERQFGTLNTGLLVGMEGRVMKLEPRKIGRSLPVMSYADFQRVLVHWITEVLHCTPGPDGDTALKRWQSSVAKYGNPQPMDPEQVRISLARTAERDARPEGIKLNSIIYNSPLLSALRRNHKKVTKTNQKVMVKWDSEDLGMIWVRDPQQNLFFPVPALDRTFEGMTHFKHRVICTEIAARKKAGLADIKYIEAERIIDAFIRGAVKKHDGQKTSRKLAQIETSKTKKPPRFDGGELPEINEDELPDFGDPVASPADLDASSQPEGAAEMREKTSPEITPELPVFDRFETR